MRMSSSAARRSSSCRVDGVGSAVVDGAAAAGTVVDGTAAGTVVDGAVVDEGVVLEDDADGPPTVVGAPSVSDPHAVAASNKLISSVANVA